MSHKVPLLADDYIIVYESSDPTDVYCYSPGIARCPGGRLIVTCDIGGPGVNKLEGAKARIERKKVSCFQGKLSISDDHGLTWEHKLNFPFLHARPFLAGNKLYLLGHCGRLAIMRSDDMGDTWSEVSYLSQTTNWHQAPCNVCYANEKIYLVMEQLGEHSCTFSEWPPSRLAPVVMAGHMDKDLTNPDSWTFSNRIYFDEVVGQPSMIGVPFWSPGSLTPNNAKDPRVMPPLGWLETNLVQFTDPEHIWHDPSGRTLHLWMRANSGVSNLACIAKVVEDSNEQLTVMLEKSPSGNNMVFVPCPGGYMKFHILFDEITNLFWLISSFSTDSMTRPEALSDDRFSIPTSERNVLALHFSKNCMDWCMAGIIARGNTPRQARNYPSAVIDGEDMHVLSRSGNNLAYSAHNGNLITFHTIKKFRQLIY